MQNVIVNNIKPPIAADVGERSDRLG